MARSWPASRAKAAALAVIDALGYTVTAPLRLIRRRVAREDVRNILVVEPWQIGDVVLVTPLLRELRNFFPDASVALLAKRHASEILSGSGLVDEVIEADLPWTRSDRKYRTSPAERRALRQLVRNLRRRKFDLLLDARGDPRSHLLGALAGAKMRIGYNLAGGWLLTHALSGEPDERHKIDDWLKLLAPFGRESARRAPRLRPDESSLSRARDDLARAGATARPIIGFHPGASHVGKRWPLESYAELAGDLRRQFGGSTVVFVEPGGFGSEAEWPDGAVSVRGGLGNLMSRLACCDVLVCNDSGPMHLADALGVPLVAVFERGNPQWFGPSGAKSRVIMGEDAGKGLSPEPVSELPASPVPLGRVADVTSRLLEECGFKTAGAH